MQDRYAGDIGDYGKIGLLKALRAQGLLVGVNWYRVDILDAEKKADGSFKQKDGKHLIPEKFKDCDLELANKLTAIATSIGRSINAIEKADLIPDAVYFYEPVNIKDRTGWFARSLDALEGADVVFLDPDNGFQVDSVGINSTKSVKYVLYDEVGKLIANQKSVLVYSHRCRKQKDVYFDGICGKLQDSTGIPAEDILKITFPRYSVRDYFAIPVSADHREKIGTAFREMTEGIWGHMGMCRID